jgi:hypothetical protein
MKEYSDRIEQIGKIAGEMLEFREKRNLKEETKGGNIMTPTRIDENISLKIKIDEKMFLR